MSKILIERSTVEQALEALEEAVKFWHEEFEYRSCVDAADPWEEAATALKAALAEPVQLREHCLWARNGNEPCPHVQQAEPVQEPEPQKENNT